jgi:hypothetical protein
MSKETVDEKCRRKSSEYTGSLSYDGHVFSLPYETGFSLLG